MDAVAAPPAKAEIVTRPRPSKTIRSDSASTKARRFRMRARAASARRKSRQTGSAPVTMCSIIEQTAADMARLDPSHRECPRLSQPTAETALRRQSMSVTFQPMPPRESTVGSPARLGTRLAGCTLPRSNGPWRVEKRRGSLKAARRSLKCRLPNSRSPLGPAGLALLSTGDSAYDTRVAGGDVPRGQGGPLEAEAKAAAETKVKAGKRRRKSAKRKAAGRAARSPSRAWASPRPRPNATSPIPIAASC